MSTATLVRLGRSVAVLGIVSAVTVMVTHASFGVLDVTFQSFNLHTALFCVVLGAVVWVAVPQQPRNIAVWMIVAALVFDSIELLSWSATAALTTSELGVDVYRSVAELEASPADLTTGIAWGFWFSWWAWLPGFLGFLSLGLLWFPDGRLPSRRWRWAAVLAGVGLVLTMVGNAIVFRPGSDVPYGTTSSYPGFGGFLITVGFPTLGAAIFAAAASLFVRYRAGDVVVRHQLRWIGLGAATLGGSFLATLFVGATAMAIATLATLPIFLGGYGIAILKYRLYDIDVVISRTVTFGALAAFIAAVYALVVVGAGSLIDRTEEPHLWLSIGATAIVAVLFEPFHSRIRRFANRLVYGERSTPYSVLANITATWSTEGTADDALARLAELVALGTGAESASVWLQVGDALRRVVSWPVGDGRDALDVDRVGSLGADFAVPVTESGETLGAIAIEKSRSDPVTDGDRRLVADVAAGAGLLFRNIRLRAELLDRAEQLRVSRRRLVAAHDAERHRLERDLHDGAQQQVVALKVKLGLAKAVAAREGATQVAELVSALADDSQQAVDAMRVVARGIYPPLLEAEGLGAALAAAQRSAAIPVDIQVNGIGRYPRHVEQTAYFCVLEVMEMAVQSGAKGVSGSLSDASGEILIEIDHDGRATDLAAVTDRTDAFGGTTSIEARSGARIRVISRIPAGEQEMEPV